MDSNLIEQESFKIWQKRMLFACKRGNLECELLLNHFINQLDSAPASQRLLIEQFLQETEQALFHWLLKPINKPQQAHHTALPAHYRKLISEIQQVYLKK